jgi:protein tyrosine/serine phosphatase
MSTLDRRLTWDGCFNVRDLGGLPTADGRLIRPGALVRSDKVGGLSADGWASLVGHGVRTIVDLRDPSEHQPDIAPRPLDLMTVSSPLEDQSDTVFWAQYRSLSSTPLYYRPFLERFPRRIVAALAAIAEAPPGGVLVHCAAGRDRTGMVTLVLLALLGVAPEAIVADYLLSAEGLRRRSEHQGRADEDVAAQAILRRAGTTATDELTSLLASLDPAAYVQAGGLHPVHLDALRARLLAER